jgi:UDP-4-amino-4,6-dideoxy-N-acetyl-beta-L-altrosamine transaminase
MSRTLPYGRQDIIEEDVTAVVECLRSDYLTQGPRVAEFEARLCEATGAKFAVAVSSGTAALHLANLALGIGPGDVAITSPITFVASANALRFVGATVHFTDVDPATGLLDIPALETAVEGLLRDGRRVRAIVPVHLAGQPVDLSAVRRIAARAHAAVIEDAAHALGSSYEEAGERIPVGACRHSDAVALSFHPVKHITTAEGGAVLTEDPALHRRLVELRSHGLHKDASRFSRAEDDPMVGPWYYEQEELGYNYRLTDMQCALGLSQLKRLSDFVARRRALAARYDAALAGDDLKTALSPLTQRPKSQSAYHLYVVQVRGRSDATDVDLARKRKDLYGFLWARGVHCQVHYIPVHWQPYHRATTTPSRERCPGAVAYYSRSVSLPLFPAMTDSDQDRVLESLRAWVRERWAT